jgi:hypothetical protein
MPTNWKRIAVTNDPELAEALERVAPFFPSTPPARVVHDLAVKGAEAVVGERASHGQAIERLVTFSTGDDGLIDWDVLEGIDERGWDG